MQSVRFIMEEEAMTGLGYKTKDNKNPYGKMKIYFCSTRKDFEYYFESVSEAVLCEDKCFDYAIWYDKDEHSSDGVELDYSYLTEMRMFIVLVTSNFFESGSKAEKELEFAIKNKIPVLPLLAEKGIETLFNAKFGDLHALSIVDGFDKEDYQKNLKRFLDTVLLGEKLLKEIRDLKEDYIFLSYRKKDREQALALMKQLHEEEGCEEIAIWYDEYLMPGENFDTYIEERLRNSKAFVLTVTPHILEEENYIITTEYKAARDKRESDSYEIFPIEMVDLSEQEKEDLKQKYEDLPECVYKQDRAAIREWLQQVFFDNQNKDGRYHFLIGLAYLKGINRERDGERAERLIKKAAVQKKEDAIRRLISMYEFGDGVERDKGLQIYWQEMLVDKLGKAYQSNKKNPEALEKFIFESIQLGELYYSNRQFGKACKLYENTLVLFKQVKSLTSELLREYIQLMLHYIEIKEETTKNPAEIRNLLMKCKELRNAGFALIKKSKNARHSRDLYMVRLEEADLHWGLKEYSQAEKIYEETIENLKYLTFNKELGVYYSDLIHVYQKRGALRLERGEVEKSRTDLEEALKLNQEWEQWKDSEDVQYDFSLNYEKLGDFYWRVYGKEQLGVVEDCFEKSIQYLKKVMQGQRHMGMALELVTLYRRIGGVYVDADRIEEAEKVLSLALGELEGISKQTDQAEVHLHTGECYGDFADIYYEQYSKKLLAGEETKEAFEKVVEYAEKACVYAEKAEITIRNATRRQCILNKCYQYLAVGYLYTEEDERTAILYYEKALAASTNEYVKEEEDFISAATYIKSRLADLK